MAGFDEHFMASSTSPHLPFTICTWTSGVSLILGWDEVKVCINVSCFFKTGMEEALELFYFLTSVVAWEILQRSAGRLWISTTAGL